MFATWNWTTSVSHGWPAKGVGTGAGDSRPGPIGRECHSESMSPRIAQTSRPTTTQRRSTVTLQLTYPCPHVVTYRKIPIHTLFIPYPYLIHTLFPIPYSHLYRKDTLSNSNGGDARIFKVLKEEVVYSRCVVRIFLEGVSKRKCTFPI